MKSYNYSGAWWEDGWLADMQGNIERIDREMNVVEDA